YFLTRTTTLFLCTPCLSSVISCSLRFFFNATATPEIYTLSLHDALPIFYAGHLHKNSQCAIFKILFQIEPPFYINVKNNVFSFGDRKSTRLNSSHVKISYAVFCLKKKTK